ncbi:MAG: trimethylamine methyltransferase family protein, partial [Chloroflexi bacterium]|nr:trimethylamine methyltransferase family protein [Chloroflexota bacterium]
VYARNPANNVILGGNHIVCAPVYGPPFVHDLDHGRRDAKLSDFQNFVKMAQMTPQIHTRAARSSSRRMSRKRHATSTWSIR